ncbi:MAG TPA: type II toxin-antitoxin system VapC family toxin [Polyangiaceae bacterium]|nr:type II toxin-antitoxin system VapC family toxin [Polyangiaceae bacterium]
MKAADSSGVIAAFASWHEKHEQARRLIDAGIRVVGHCTLETYSVLTRLPAPHRVSGDVVRDFLRARFKQPFLRLGAKEYRQFVLGLHERGIVGGAVYDALVGATAATHDFTLYSCDRRAAATYERYAVRFEVL